MAKNYKETAESVLRLIGGQENVTHLEHCSTRLRFSVADPDKIEKEKLKATPGVMGLISSGSQCQVVIGNDVIEVYDELRKLADFEKTGSSRPAAKGKSSLGATILDFMVGVFQPLVPAIAGAGILKALLSLLVLANVLDTTHSIYIVLFHAADAALYYLPVLVAVTMSTKLGINRLVAVASVGSMLLPALTTAISDGLTLFGFQVQNISYSYQVFPAILCVAFLYYVEKAVTRISPKPIRVFFVPMVCFAIVVPVTLLLLGPLGYNFGRLLTTVILFLYRYLGWIAVAVLAALLPFMISLGMHKALVPYAVSSITEMGEELLYLPASLAHNISESGACFAVAVKTRNKDLKSASVSAGISAMFGITEPALYGVTLQHKRALYGVISGSFIGGLTVGLAGLKAFVAMGPGLAGMAMFVDVNNGMNIVWAFAGFGISLLASFLATALLYRDEDENANPEADAAAPVSVRLLSPLNGRLMELSKVEDDVFSEGILGEGMAILPGEGRLFAPADGVIASVFDTGHAISMVCDNGAELLLHVGIDTVKLGGSCFSPHVKEGDRVKAGQLLSEFDLQCIEQAGYSPVSPIIITNSAEYTVETALPGDVAAGDAIMKIQKKDAMKGEVKS